MSKTFTIFLCLILSTPIIMLLVISLTHNYNVNNKYKFENYLKSGNCYIVDVKEGKEYYIYRYGHKLKAVGEDKTEYKCTDGNSYIR